MNEQMKLGRTLIDTETGEVIENVKSVITVEQEKVINDKRKMSDENRIFVDTYGNFIFKNDSNRVNKLENKISESDIARLIYCATYINYDNILYFDDGKPILKSDLKRLINVSDKIFYKWYNGMVKKNIIVEDDRFIKMNKNYCIKGKLSKNKNYNRLFINSIRYIYEENQGKKMSTFGNIIKMLPYVNTKYNILCWNPEEMDENKINPIRLNELTEIFEEYKTNPKLFMNQIGKFRISDGEPVMIFSSDDDIVSESYIMFNPRLTYSGKNEDLPITHKMFIFMKNKYNSKNQKNHHKNSLKHSNTNALNAPK